MSHRSLAALIESLHREDQLARIETEVSADLEIAEITARVAHQRGPALLFTQVTGCALPVVTNLFGTPARLLAALQAESIDDWIEQLQQACCHDSPQGWLSRIRSSTPASPLVRFAPKQVKVALCQQVVELGRDIDLRKYALGRCWPEQSFPLLAAAQIVYRCGDPVEQVVEIGDVHVTDARQLGIQIAPDSKLAEEIVQAKGRGESVVAVAVLLGGSPLAMLLAHLATLLEMPPWSLAGALSEHSLEIVPGRTQGVDLLAEAELVIEGEIDPAGEPVTIENTIRPSGHYSGPLAVTTINVTAVTRRKKGVLPGVVYATPPQELHALDALYERLVLRKIQSLVPAVVDLTLPDFGADRKVCLLSLDAKGSQDARRAAHAVWALESLQTSRIVVVVGSDVDVRNRDQVLFRIAGSLPAGLDCLAAGSTDQTGRNWSAWGSGLAGRILIDATGVASADGRAERPQVLKSDERVVRQVAERWTEYGL